MEGKRRVRGGTNVTIKSTLHGEITFSKTEAGLMQALAYLYGEDYTLATVDDIATLTIPEADKGSWIGTGGRVVSTLSTILRVSKVIVRGKS